MPGRDGRTWPEVLHPIWLRWLTRRNEVPARVPTEIEPRVWVGGVPSARRWRVLRECGVAAVVALTAELAPPGYLRSAVRVLWLPVPDGDAPSDGQLTLASALLDATLSHDEGVFIYCGSGLGRAPTLWAGWRVRRGDPAEVVLTRLRTRRPIANLMPRQLAALARWGMDGRSRP